MASFLSKPSKWNGRVLLLTFLGVFFLLTWVCGLSGGHVVFWRELGVPTFSASFADMQTITGGWQSQQENYDPLVENPYDPWQRPMNYPRIWLKLPLLGLRPNHLLVMGICLAVAFYISAFGFVGRPSGPQSLVYGLAMCSPVATLAVERANNDLSGFVLITLGLMLVRHWKALRPTLYVMILLAALLKLFPIAGIVSAIREKPKWAFITFSAVGLTFGAYIFFTYDDLRLIYQALPKSFACSYGSMVFFKFIHVCLQPLGLGLPTVLLGWLSAIACIGLVFLLARKSPGAAAATWSKSEYLDSFRIGTAIYAGTFIIGHNFDYRLVFLILTLPQLIRWSQDRRRFGVLPSLLLTSVMAALWFLFVYKRVPDEAALIVDEINNWFIFAGLIYLLLMSLPGWLRSGLLQCKRQ